MAGSNDFLPFSVGGNANVLTQTAYAARSELTNGVQSGQASSSLYNKHARQASIMAAMIGQFIATYTNQNVVDDGTITTLLTQFAEAIQFATRVKFTANTNFYVNPSSGNNSNDGLTSAAPFQTLQGAVDAIYRKYDFNNYIATINLANGTYSSPQSGQSVLNVAGRPVGANTFNPINIVGNPASPGSVVLNGLANSAVVSQFGASITCSGVTFQSTGTGLIGAGLAVESKGTAFIAGPCQFSTCGGPHILATAAGEFIVMANYTVSGNATMHYEALEQGRISIGGVTITTSGNPAFTTAFADCESNSTIVQSGATFTGNATGPRYRVLTGGAIVTNGGNNYFPGSIAGSTDQFSVYV